MHLPTSTLLPLLLLPFTLAINLEFYPDPNCSGNRAICSNVFADLCCWSPNGYRSFKTNVSPSAAGLPPVRVCAYTNCAGLCVINMGTFCFNGAWAILSASMGYTSLREPAVAAIRVPGRRSLVEGQEFGLVEDAKPSKECVYPDTAVYVDEADGMEVFVEIPKGREEEIVGALKDKDMKKLKTLKVKKREKKKAENFEIVDGKKLKPKGPKSA